MEIDFMKLVTAAIPVLLVVIGGITKGKVDLQKTLEAAEDAIPDAIEAFDKDKNLEGAAEVGVGVIRMIRKGSEDRRLSKKMERKGRARIKAALKRYKAMKNGEMIH
jgi:hypothetical protein